MWAANAAAPGTRTSSPQHDPRPIPGHPPRRRNRAQPRSAHAPAPARFASPRRARAARRLRRHKRQSPLRLRLRRDEVGQTFGFRQIKLAIAKARRVNSPASAMRQPSITESATSRASTTARPPCTWNSAQSSPVKLLAGHGKNKTRPLSELVARCANRRRQCRTCRGVGTPPAIVSRANRTRGPDSLTTAMPAGRRPLDSAKIVSPKMKAGWSRLRIHLVALESLPTRNINRRRSRSDHAAIRTQPAFRRSQSLSPSACRKSGALAPVGRGRARRSPTDRQADPCFPSAMPPATGATSWRTKASRTPRSPTS